MRHAATATGRSPDSRPRVLELLGRSDRGRLKSECLTRVFLLWPSSLYSLKIAMWLWARRWNVPISRYRPARIGACHGSRQRRSLTSREYRDQVNANAALDDVALRRRRRSHLAAAAQSSSSWCASASGDALLESLPAIASQVTLARPAKADHPPAAATQGGNVTA